MKIKIFTVMFLLFFAADAFAFEVKRPRIRVTKPRVTLPVIPTIPTIIVSEPTLQIALPTIPKVTVSTTSGGSVSSEQIKALEAAIQDLQNQIDAIDINGTMEPFVRRMSNAVRILTGQINAIRTQINALPPQLDPYSVITPIFSGNCSINTPISSNPDPNYRAKFCLDRVKFNTAQNYLSVDPNGIITVLITGLYNFDIGIDGAEELVINGVNQFPTFVYGMYPLWAGDVFYWQLIAFNNIDSQKIKINYAGAHNLPNPSIPTPTPTPTPTPIPTR